MDKRRSLSALDWLSFFMADVETGIGPFVAAYLSAAWHWNPAQIGMVLGAQSMAQVLAQAPAGWLIDHIRRRKWLLAGAAVAISIGALLIASIPSVRLQMANQIAIGLSVAFVSPTIAALSLGLVGRESFSRRVGRNAAFSHGGNVTTALLAGYVGYALGQQWIFYSSAALGLAVIACIMRIRDADVDENAARALPGKDEDRAGESRQVYSIAEVFTRTRIGLFAAVVVVFHLANSPMLSLAGQELAKVKKGTAPLFMSGCIVTAQAVMVPMSYLLGRITDRIGRKPILLTGFAVLALRGLLFAQSQNAYYIVGVEALDGVGTAIGSVIGILIVSDLAKGTGRFNLMQGIFQAAVGVGAFLGNSAAGLVAKAAGFPIAFAVLASVAVTGLILYAMSMSETADV